jgi:hypothetical protein
MGIERPSKQWFSGFLKDSIAWSKQKRYHKMPLSQGEALALRLLKEPSVQIAGGVEKANVPVMPHPARSFFPVQEHWSSRGNRRRS